MEEIIASIDKRKPRVAILNKLSFNEPIGIGYLSSYLKQHFPGIQIQFFDTDNFKISEVDSFHPSVIMYSVMTGQHQYYFNLNIQLKNKLKPFISIFGGSHPTYFPEMINREGIDIICRGEGELPLKNFFLAAITNDDFRSIPGMWVKSDGEIYTNEVEPLIEDLDNLALPDRNLYYDKSSFLRQYGRKPIVGARGCPYNCSYCYNSGFKALYRGKGKILRNRSPQSIIDEIISLKNTCNLNFIAFIEDVFSGFRIGWLREFHDLYSKVKIPFFISIRAEFVTPEIAQYLRKSGCVSASMAIEHGDYDYRREYLFRNMSDEMLIDATKILETVGIRVASPIILGLPFSSFDKELKTLKLLCKTNPTHATTAIYQPYPGTALTDRCLENGLMEKADIDNLPDDFFSKTHIKGVDYEKVLILHHSFSLLWIMHKWFGIDVEKWFYKLPENIIIRIINTVIKYFTFIKIIRYKRSFGEAVKEIYYALKTGVFGVKLKK